MKFDLYIYAVHPIMYQTPIFTQLKHRTSTKDFNFKVLFGDDLSLREVYLDAINTVYKPDVDFLLKGYEYEFLRNYSSDSRKGFFSRINPGIFLELLFNRPKVILIHGYDTCSSWIAILSAWILRIPTLWRGEAVLRGNEDTWNLKVIVKKIILTLFFKMCNGCLYSCTGNKDFLLHYKVSDLKLFPIPCAVNNQYFLEEKQRYLPRLSSIKEEIGVSEDQFVILFSARFTKRKRPYDLIQAVIQANLENYCLLFVGDGPERKAMEAMCKQHKLNAVFVGFKNQSEISLYYSLASVAIIISDYDPSPKAMNEIMNFSVPVITTENVGTAHDLVEDGKNGYIIKLGDRDSLAEKLSALYYNPKLQKSMGEAGFKKVQEWNYTKDVDGILDAYSYVTNSNRPKTFREK